MPEQWCWTRINDAMQRNRNDTYKCFSEVLQIILETSIQVFIIIFENIVGLISVILGLVYMKDCSVDPNIPLSLVVFGVFSLIHGVTVQLIRFKVFNIEDPHDGFATLIKIILCVTSLGAFICFIWVAIVVYSAYGKVNTHGGLFNRCNFYLYWFAFVFITIVVVLLLLILFLICCMCCCVVVGGGTMAEMPGPTVIILGGKEGK